MSRPRLALAMWDGLEDAVLTGPQWDRLDAVADVVDRRPLACFDDERAAVVLADVEVLLGHWGCPRLDAEALALAPRLRMLAYAAGTLREVLTPAVWERDLRVTSGAPANAVPTAEYAAAVVVLANKDAFVSHERFRDPERAGPWPTRSTPVGNLGKRVGIVGASNVGRKVIDLLGAHDLEIVVHDPYLDAADAHALGVARVDLDELLATSDVVSLHAPLLPATERMIGAPELARLRDGAVFVNTARGGLVDSDALEAELVSGRISAVLDVTDPEPLPRSSPLYALPNVFLTPHIAGSAGTEYERLADCALDEIERYARGEPAAHPVVAADIGRIA